MTQAQQVPIQARPDNAHCRLCRGTTFQTFADLGMQPLSNGYVPIDRMDQAVAYYPLRARVCTTCWLVQVGAYETPEGIFAHDYAYFSSYSESWLRHAKQYADMITSRLGLGPNSRVVEIASNDGYLLQYVAKKNIPVLGVEPAKNCAQAAEERGVPTHVAFFGETTARSLKGSYDADLMVANNVLAHVPDILDFLKGFQVLLKPSGTVTFEFPHLLRLVKGNFYDTIYHEHFSYLSLGVVDRALRMVGLRAYDVEELPTHGGSLRVYATHVTNHRLPTLDRVRAMIRRESEEGLNDAATYQAFAERVVANKMELLTFLIDAKRAGKRVVGYGAPAKANTLLNYCGIGPELMPYTVDRSPHKQGHVMPGSCIPIHAPERIFEDRPDYVLILPWNLRDEIVEQLSDVRSWGAKFVLPMPHVVVE